MPRLISCEFENFALYERGEITYGSPGLVLVQGVNKDSPKATSNKSGKSSAFVEAPVWCLYGQGVKEKSESGSRLSTYSNDKVVRIGASAARVKVKFAVGDAVYAVERHQKGATQRLYLWHNDDPVKGSSKAATQAVIDGLVGTYDSFCHQVLFGQNVRRFSTATDSDRKAILETLLPDLSVYTKARQEVSRLLPKRTKALDKAENKEEYLSAYIKSIKAEYEEELSEYKEKLAEWKESSKKREEKEDQISTRIENNILLRNKLSERISERRDKLTALKLPEDLKKLDSTVRGYESDEAKLSWDLDRIRRRVNSGIPNLPVTCNECEQPVSQEYKSSLLSKYEEEMKNVQVRLNATRKLLKTARKSFSRAERVSRKKSSLENSITLCEEKLSGINNVLKNLNSQLADVKTSKPQKPSRSRLNRVKSELKKRAKELKSQKHRAERLRAEVSDLKFWHVGFGPAGIKSDLLEGVMPLINEAAGQFMSELLGSDTTVEFKATTLQKSGKEVEKCSIEIHNENDQGYDTASEGERKRLDLCIALALQSLSQNPFNVMICDEPFESVDEAGQASMVDLLNKYSQEKGICVYVLTYLSDIYSLFSRTVTVVREGGVARVETK